MGKIRRFLFAKRQSLLSFVKRKERYIIGSTVNQRHRYTTTGAVARTCACAGKS
jgi:hypothetical protein